MHILLDVRPFSSGISYSDKMYSEDLFQALFRNFPSDVFFIWTMGKKKTKNIFSFSLDSYSNVKRIHNYSEEGMIDFSMKYFSYPKIDDIAETEAMKKGLLPWVSSFDATIFLAPYCTPLEDNCLKVACVNDLSEFHFPEYFSKDITSLYSKKNYKHELSHTDLLCVPSQFVKSDVMKTFKIEEEKIYILGSGITEMVKNKKLLEQSQMKEEVITNANTSGEQHPEKKSSEEEKSFSLDTLPEVFFFVRGVNSKLKNFSVLLKAYSLFEERFMGNDSWKLVIEEETEGDLRNEKYFSKNIFFLPPLSQNQRIDVLEKANSFIYPSLYDGGGKALLEAMRCGCPVISSDFAALPEVYGDAGIAFDPTSYSALFSAMKKVFQEKDLQHALSEKGVERSYDSLFLWDDISERLMHQIAEKREEKTELLESE